MKTPTPIIPGYELRECLGRGGASIVYKGLEKHSGQTVAIKILRKRFNHDLVLQRRFQEEFRILRNLDHRNLAAVDDVHVGPPGADAVQSLLEYFKQSTAGSHDLERLRKYVGDHRESAGALVGAMKKALLSGRMELAGGRVGLAIESAAANDLFGMRKSSRVGLAEVRCLFSGRAGRRRRHWERFFIKEAIRAERVSGHNRRLAAIFEKEITAKKRGLPLQLAIDCAHALFKLGRLAKYDKIVRDLEPVCARAPVDARAAVALVRCWVTIETGSERKALTFIEKFLEQLDRVSPDIRHSLEAHNASMKIWLRRADAESYFARVNASLESAGQIENLLIMHLRKIMQNLHRAEYSEARAGLEEAIKIARESRIYYRLAHAFVQLSAVYYETGHYARALEYLDLGYRLTVSVGRDTWAGGYMVRYSMIYKKLGLYGLYIKAVHRALRRPAVRSNPQDRLRLYLTLFELYNEIGSGLARGCRRRCESLLADCGDVVLNAWYACETGVFMQGRGDLAAAEKYYKTAVDQCKRAGMRDDEALVRIRLANLYVETGRFAPADAQARSVKKILRTMESAALENRSRLLELSLEYARRSGRAALGKQVERCEQIRPGITDVGLAVDADALLFRAQARLGKLEESKRYFDSYFKTIKKIASGLAGVTDLDTLRVGPDFDLTVHEYRLVLGRLDAARRTTPC